jgi:hypothetical protein
LSSTCYRCKQNKDSIPCSQHSSPWFNGAMSVTCQNVPVFYGKDGASDVQSVHDFRSVFKKYVHLAHTQYISGTTSNSSSTRPVKRNVHVHHRALSTGDCTHTYSLLRHSAIYLKLCIHMFRLPNTRLEQHRPRFLKMRASAARQSGGAGTVKYFCLLDSRQASQIP